MDKVHKNFHIQILEAALVRHKKGDISYANRIYRQVLQENPRHPLALHYLGLIAQQTGYSKQAVRLIQQSIKEDPTDPRAYNQLGQIYLHMGDPSRPIACFKKALKIDPGHVDSLNNYANQLVATGEIKEAIVLYRRVVELDGNVSHSPYNLAKTLKTIRAFTEAIEWYKKTIRIDPDHILAHHGLGLIYEEMGDFKAATQQYLKTLDIEPDYVRAVSNLLAIKSFKPSKDIIEKAERILRHTRCDEVDMAKMHHGLGKYYDRMGGFDRAFGHFSKSNELQKSYRKPYCNEKISRYVDQSVKALDSDYFKGSSSLGNSGSEPIFIVGMPRSGTTMTEQILASHPDVFGAGELLKIPHISRDMLPRFPLDLLECEQDYILEMAEKYLNHIHEFAPQNIRHVTDKLPTNFLHLGLIATLFPMARVIYCRRDPMDVGLSCFIEMFQDDNDFTLKLEDFGAYFLEQERIMAHWCKVLSIPIYIQKYEDIVNDQEACTRDLIAFCGLEWHDACLSFHQTKRVINTPSRWQVRQPMYKSSVGRWKNYEKHLLPLTKILSNYTY